MARKKKPQKSNLEIEQELLGSVQSSADLLHMTTDQVKILRRQVREKFKDTFIGRMAPSRGQSEDDWIEELSNAFSYEVIDQGWTAEVLRPYLRNEVQGLELREQENSLELLEDTCYRLVCWELGLPYERLGEILDCKITERSEIVP